MKYKIVLRYTFFGDSEYTVYYAKTDKQLHEYLSILRGSLDEVTSNSHVKNSIDTIKTIGNSLQRTRITYRYYSSKSISMGYEIYVEIRPKE